MNKQPLVTVICICYNHQKYVIETIQSVLHQTYSPIEIIVIDDKSSDRSVELIQDFLADYPAIQLIQNTENLGNTKTFNKAVGYAHGEYLIDLACDDILLPHCVETQVATFLQNKTSDIGIVFGNSEQIDESGMYLRDYFPTDGNRSVCNKALFSMDLEFILQGGLCMNSASAMMHRGIFEQLGKYDERLAFEDLDYWIRVLEKYRIVFIDDILSQKRDVKNSMGAHFFQHNDFANALDLSMLRVLKQTIDRHRTEAPILRAIRKRIHNGIENSWKGRKYNIVWAYLWQKLRIHYWLLFAK